MATYYCHECARRYGRVDPADTSELSADEYQLEQFVKHTAPTGVYPTNSVFHDGTWETYRDFVVTTAVSGCLEIDARGRNNLIYFAGKETGLRYENGAFTSLCSGVKVVCSESAGRIHAFPSNFHAESQTCADCGRPVPFDPR